MKLEKEKGRFKKPGLRDSVFTKEKWISTRMHLAIKANFSLVSFLNKLYVYFACSWLIHPLLQSLWVIEAQCVGITPI